MAEVPVASAPTPSSSSVATDGVTSTGSTTPLQTQAADGVLPRYEKAACPFELVPKLQIEGKNISCGYLVVPEEHRLGGSKPIRLAVAVLRSSNREAATAVPPLVMLQGGPGGTSQNLLQLFAYEGFPMQKLLADCDIIMLDQRGVGYSQPSLYCTEIEDLSSNKIISTSDTTNSNRADNYDQALLACRARLVKEGVNLSAYNSAESAADINALRLVLRYPAVDLYGVSYGTRLALTVMRDYPKAVHSVILDGTYLPQATEADLPGGAEAAFLELFRACAAEADCNKNYPNLRETFVKAFDKLDDEPASVNIKNPSTGEDEKVDVDGYWLVETIFNTLYSTELLPVLPSLIAATAEGKYDLLSYFLPYSFYDSRNSKYSKTGWRVSRGMYYSVQCTEEAPFTKVADIKAAAKGTLPEVRKVFVASGLRLLSVCNRWNVTPARTIENEPVTSPIPTLVLAGEFDPITPPSAGQEALKTLPHSFYVKFSGFGHSTITTSTTGLCPTSVMAAFLKDPTTKPASDCTISLSPRFVTPNQLESFLKAHDIIK